MPTWGGGGYSQKFRIVETSENQYPIKDLNMENEAQFKGKTRPKNQWKQKKTSLNFAPNQL